MTGRTLSPGLLTVLGYLSMAGSLTTDLYLPAFPDIAEDFGVGASTVQLTLTAYLVGAALGQLMIGSVSDALGRRRTLVVAMAVFAACSYLAVFSPTIWMLIAVRAVQGFAGSAGTVLSRAVVSDLVDHDRAVRAFSTLWIMIALGPAIASPLGAGLTALGGWRAALLGLAVLATGMLLASLTMVPETLPRERRHPFTASALAGNIGRLLRNPVYVGYAVAFAAGYGALMTYISSSSFIVQDVLGVGPLAYALTFSLGSVAIMAGAFLNGRVAPRVGASTALRVALAIQGVAGVAGVVLAVTDTLTMVTYLVLLCVFAIGSGAVLSNGSALAIGQARTAAGAGSAALGFAQFLFGALVSPLGGVAGTATAVPAMITLTACAAVGLAAGIFAAARAHARAGR